MPDVQLNGQSITTTSATTAPAAGTVETWTVSALASGIPGLVAGQTYLLADATPLATLTQQNEMIRILSAAAGATSISVQRGVNDTTPVAHQNPSVFAVIADADALNRGGYEIAYGENTTSTATGATTVTGIVQVADVFIAVEPQASPWALEACATLQAFTSFPNPGLVFIQAYDTTGAGSTLVGAAEVPTVAANVGAQSSWLGNCRGLWRMLPTTVWKYYTLYIGAAADSAAMGVVAQNAPYYPSWIRAFVP